MSEAPPRVRPMTAADYLAGAPVMAAHPTRDLILGAVVGAAALWLVPRVLDYVVGGGWLQHGDEEELEITE